MGKVSLLLLRLGGIISTGRDKVSLMAEETLPKHCIVGNLCPHLPSEFLFGNGGDALDLIDGWDSRGKLVGTHDWSIRHSEGELPVQMLFVGSRKQQNSNVPALKVLHLHIYGNETPLVQDFIQANPARSRVELWH